MTTLPIQYKHPSHNYILLQIHATRQRLPLAIQWMRWLIIVLAYALAEIPQCIHDVPYAKGKYLSPVYLHTSLGRSAGGANPFVEYCSLTGQMGHSRNRRTLTLYHPSLRYACDWLQHNNLMAYHSLASHLLASNSHLFGTHISDEDFTPPVHFSDIVMPSYV